MRIAVSGSHRVGKTTLVEALAEALPRYEVVPEPYHLLEEDGHQSAELPSIQDFEAQLERSFRSVQESGTNAVLDRCPLDILGYLIAHRDADTFRLEDWMQRVQETVAELDLIVYVPIEEPDRIAVSPADAAFRAEVDAVLRDLIVDDAYGLGFDLTVVEGGTAERVRQVMAERG